MCDVVCQSKIKADTYEGLDEAGTPGRLDQDLLDLVVMDVVSDREGSGDEGARGTDDGDGVGGNIEVGQGHEVAAFVLDLGVEKPALGDPSQKVSNPAEMWDFWKAAILK